MSDAINGYDVEYDELADIIFELGYDTNENVLRADGSRIRTDEAVIVESF
jgi:hypothetical protein